MAAAAAAVEAGAADARPAIVNTANKVVARSENVIRLPLRSSGYWYDFSVTVKGQADYSRRFAGRLETGQASFSDPAMFGAAIGNQLKIG